MLRKKTAMWRVPGMPRILEDINGHMAASVRNTPYENPIEAPWGFRGWGRSSGWGRGGQGMFVTGELGMPSL